VIIKSDGSTIKVTMGEDSDDPVFTITDLLPHLAQDQMQKKMSDGITGEGLNLLFGSIPHKVEKTEDDEKAKGDEKIKDKVKHNILKLLHEKYNIIEEDMVSAELEIVPAFKASDVGLDRGIVGAYGQDDRVCSYAALEALLQLKTPKKTAVCLLVDKEEIGSNGNTGAGSVLFENFMAEICALTTPNYSDLSLRRVLSKSKMLSADVNPGVDPNFEGVNDKKNSSYMSKGVVVQKYTGSRGKVGASDANPEFIAEVRQIFNNNKISWQTGELGKVDQGGGGTIAHLLAKYGIDVLDCGVPILSMHSPFELTSKIDIINMFNGFLAFYKEAK
jgi:aspartyl aminopeptidase